MYFQTRSGLASAQHHSDLQQKPSKIMKKTNFDDVAIIFYYKQTRVNDVDWEMEARDRFRFLKRITDINQSIGWIFKENHRSRMYNTIERL